MIDTNLLAVMAAFGISNTQPVFIINNTNYDGVSIHYEQPMILFSYTGYKTNGYFEDWTYPTNVNFTTNYLGTIQVGTNYYRVDTNKLCLVPAQQKDER
jgi:hypothetical protein